MTGPVPQDVREQRLADLGEARRRAVDAEESAIVDAAQSGVSAYRIAQLVDRSPNGVRVIIRRRQEKP